MKNLITTFSLILLLATLCLPKTYLSKPIIVDGYFSTYYSNISWEDQKAELDNFAGALMREPDYVGYIGFSKSEEKESFQKAKSRINRAVKYLTQHRKIEKNRIVVIYVGEKEKAQTILQPWKGLTPPFDSAAKLK